MKRKLLFVLLTVIMVVSCVIGLVACGDPADRMRRSFLCVKGEKERR